MVMKLLIISTANIWAIKFRASEVGKVSIEDESRTGRPLDSVLGCETRVRDGVLRDDCEFCTLHRYSKTLKKACVSCSELYRTSNPATRQRSAPHISRYRRGSCEAEI